MKTLNYRLQTEIEHLSPSSQKDWFKNYLKEILESDKPYYQKSDYIALSFMELDNKIDYLSSAKEWIYLREIRNEIAHQYDDEADEMTQAMNKIINQKEILKAIYLNIKEKYLKR